MMQTKPYDNPSTRCHDEPRWGIESTPARVQGSMLGHTPTQIHAGIWDGKRAAARRE
jgi:hypothetical protein